MSNLNDSKYASYLRRLQARFEQNTKSHPVFTVNVDKAKLWELYLSSFVDRQYHNCQTCHSFLNRYANLAVIDDDGLVKSAIWDPTDVDTGDGELYRAVRRIRKIVEDGKISGVWYSDKSEFGNATAGGWLHLGLRNPSVFAGNANAARNEQNQQHRMVTNALQEFPHELAARALSLLASGQLYRGAEFVADAEWFVALHKTPCSQNDIWLAVAKAPPGAAKVRSSMLGTLLKDLAHPYPVADVIKRWDTKMQQYQRSEAPPTATQIELAERAVLEMNLEASFARRYTRVEDLPIDGILWAPRNQPTPTKQSTTRVFANVKAKNEVSPGKPITLEKFAREVLANAANIEYRVPMVGRFCSLTTAADPEAPPILAWDKPERRNPVAWAFPSPPATAEQWNLAPGAWARVSAIVHTPNLWYDVQSTYGKGLFFLIDGAYDTRNVMGGGLFVEHLRSDLRPYRKVIERHLNQQRVQLSSPGMLAFGIGLLQGNKWTETAAPEPFATDDSSPAENVHVLLVIDDSASMRNYLPAARRALRSLLGAVREMPGKVDVTVFKFGTHVHVMTVQAAPDKIMAAIESWMTGDGGQTALNDAIGKALELSSSWAVDKRHRFFMGIVTDGEENQSRSYSKIDVRAAIRAAAQTGLWTIAYAGAGRNPMDYAASVGIPPGNVKVFSATSEGFEEAGAAYAASTRVLAQSYRAGTRSTDTFFSAAAGAQDIGEDFPVFAVTTVGGNRVLYVINRWE